MATFKARVACDLYGSKHNAMFLFKPPPVSLAEIIAEVQKFYTAEAESRKPTWHTGPAFSVSALQMFDKDASVWVDVTSVSQLSDGCQLYAFQQPVAPPALPAPVAPVHTDPVVQAAQAEADAAAAAAAAAIAAIPPPVPAPIPAAVDMSVDVASFQYLNPSYVAAQPQQRPKRVIQDDGTREGYAFNVLDTLADGVITLDEMIEGFQYIGLRFTPAQVQDLFIVADENGDNQVTREEFTKFANRFPTVVDAIQEQRTNEDMLEQEAVVLQEAEAALKAEQEVERKLLEEAANASKRVRDLMSQIADHKLNHEAQLQRKPVVEAQQQQLVEQELALAAQKERLRLVQENIRKDIETQLRAVSQSIGMTLNDAPQDVPPASVADSAMESALPPEDAINMPASSAIPGARGASGSAASSSSFFLPSETAAGLSKPSSVAQPLMAPASVTPAAIEVGGEVEACNFESKPEFNGLRGKVRAVMDDGRVTVDMFIRNGLTLDMLPYNVRGVVSAQNPALNDDIVAKGTGKCLASNQHVDLSGCRGRVVGMRPGVYMCEFPSRAGIFELIPDCLKATKPKSVPAAPVSSAPPTSIPPMASLPPMPSVPAPVSAVVGNELEKARLEAAQLRAELAQERARAAVIRREGSPGHAAVAANSPCSNPDIAAALARLGNLAPASPVADAATAAALCSPLQAPPPVLPPTTVPVVPDYPTYPPLPTTQEILSKAAAPQPPAAAPSQTYTLGPIDPSSL